MDNLSTFIENLGWQVNLPVGHRILCQGERSEKLYYLIEGRLRVDIDGRRVAVIEANEWIGELSAFLDDAHGADVTTDCACTLFEMSPNAIDVVFSEMPAEGALILGSIISSMASRLQTVEPESAMAILAQMSEVARNAARVARKAGGRASQMWPSSQAFAWIMVLALI